MARPMPEVEISVLLLEIYRLLLAGNQAVVVLDQGRLSGLITRADLMQFYEQTAKHDLKL
jgi:predicted transcriptional regulator